jgi:hypothetical protein
MSKGKFENALSQCLSSMIFIFGTLMAPTGRGDATTTINLKNSKDAEIVQSVSLTETDFENDAVESPLQTTDGSCGALTWQTRTHTGTWTPGKPVVVFLSAYPGNEYWLDQFGSGAGFRNTNGYKMAFYLYRDHHAMIIEHKWTTTDLPMKKCEYRKTGQRDTYYQAYRYMNSALHTIFSGIPRSDRFMVGHSWGAMQIEGTEIASIFVGINRAASLAPNGGDFEALCNTNKTTATSTCAGAACGTSSCSYTGGWAKFFKNHCTDDYEYTTDAFNAFVDVAGKLDTYDITYPETSKDCHELLVEDASTWTPILRSNSPSKRNYYYESVTDLQTQPSTADPYGHVTKYFVGIDDDGYNDVSGVYAFRRNKMNGAAAPSKPFVVYNAGCAKSDGTPVSCGHNILEWPASSVTDVVNWIANGT